MSSPVKVTQACVEKECEKTGVSLADVKKLRQWLSSQPHLPSDYITDLDLLLSYYACGRSAEVSKQVLDLNFTLRTLFTTLFKDRKVDDKVIKAMEVVLLLPLSSFNKAGQAVLYARLIDCDPKKFSFVDTIRAGFMLIDLWQYDWGCVPGAVFVVDFLGSNVGHLAKVDLQTVQQLLYYIQEALLVNISSIHFINAPSFLDKLMLLLKPFLNREFLGKIHVHTGGAADIAQYVDSRALPKEAGGDGKTMKQASEDVIKRLKLNSDYFSSENKKRVVESLRPGKPKTISDIFGGIEGSFKKLDID